MLSGALVHFPLGVDVDRAVFGTMIGFIAMVHAVHGSWCVWASASPVTFIRSSTSPVALGRSMIERSRVYVVQGCSVAIVLVLSCYIIARANC
jgi:hypothetical protein